MLNLFYNHILHGHRISLLTVYHIIRSVSTANHTKIYFRGGKFFLYIILSRVQNSSVVDLIRHIIYIDKDFDKKEEVKMSRSKISVPEAKQAMDKFKMEAASEVGVNLKNGYNGDLT